MPRTWAAAWLCGTLWACSAAPTESSRCPPLPCQIPLGIDAAGHCQYQNKANGTGCDDGNPCSAYTTCQQGACAGGTPLPNGSACDDGNACTVDDSCQGGSCVGGAPLACDGGGRCSAMATCDPKVGCVQADVGPCNEALESIVLGGCSVSAYTAPLRIGGTAFDLLLDSGSSTTAVAAARCTNCPSEVSPRYGAAHGVDQQVLTDAGYSDGSGWYASVFADQVQAGRTAAPGGDAVSMRIASITRSLDFFTGTNCLSTASQSSAAGYQGIWGLGPDGALRPNTDSFLTALHGAGSLPNDAFSLQLCDLGGRLWLGGYDPAAGVGAVAFTPMLGAGQGDANHYAIAVEDLRLGDKSLGIDSFAYGSAMVDSGTSSTVLPPAAYRAIKAGLAADANVRRLLDARTFSADDANDRYSYPSPAGATPAVVDRALPWLTWVLPRGSSREGLEVRLPPSQSYLTSWRRSTSGPVQYLYSFTLFPGDTTIVGASMLKRHVVVFDRAGRRIGFLPQGPYCSADLPVSD